MLYCLQRWIYREREGVFYMIIKAKQPEFTNVRIRAGFSQRQLARESGLSSPFISQVENGNRNVGPEAAKKLCTALSVPFEQIFLLEKR